MRNAIVTFLMLFFTMIGWAADYKVFWRCSDRHLEAIDVHESNDKKVNLFLSYIEDGKKELLSSPINLKSLVDLPANFNHENFLMLGNGERIFMNCVGQVTLSPHDILGKIVFDVSRNAYTCPLIPKDCDR